MSPPSLVVTARPLAKTRNATLAATGIAVISVPDIRWGRVDIKTISLLPNVLAKQAAIDQGARDAWFVDRDGNVTEGASANAWIVTAAGTVVTRPADHAILRGITRTVLFEAIKAQGLAIEERPFSLAEAYAAREAFATSATQIVVPVVRIDGRASATASPDRSRPRWDGRSTSSRSRGESPIPIPMPVPIPMRRLDFAAAMGLHRRPLCRLMISLARPRPFGRTGQR